MPQQPCQDRPHNRPKSRPRVGLFVTCLVDLFRPSVGFAAVKLLDRRRLRGRRADGADLLRPAGLQLRRQGDGAAACAPDDRRLRGPRLRGGAVGLLRRHAEAALPRAAGRTIRPGRPRATAFARQGARAHLLPGRRARRDGRRCRARRPAPPTTTAARACASWASGSSRGSCCARSRAWSWSS